MYGTSVSLPSDFETTSLGAWASAAMALGVYNTIPEALDYVSKNKKNTVYNSISSNIEIYNNLKIRKKAIYNALYKRNI